MKLLISIKKEEIRLSILWCYLALVGFAVGFLGQQTVVSYFWHNFYKG